MILIIPFYPCDTKRTFSRFYIGYWADVDQCPKTIKDLNRQQAREFLGCEIQKSKLPKPQDYIDDTWDVTERELVINYLENVKVVEHWRGYSYCRFGCDTNMGTTCKSDGSYTFPEGFIHYLKEHSVKPPQQFINHVLRTLAHQSLFKKEL